MTKRDAGASGREDPAMRTSEQNFHVFFTTHPTPMWIYDPETLGFVAMNDAAYALYGFSREAVAAMTVLDIRPEDERARMRAAVRDGSDLERPGRWRHLNAAGAAMEVTTYGRRIDFAGKPAILVVVQDRTELAAANRQASHARWLLDGLIDNLPLGVFVKDMQDHGRYVLFNDAATAVCGYAQNRVVGATDAEVFSEAETRAFAEQDRLVVSRGEVLSVERDVVAPDGSVRTLRVVKSLIPPAEGDAPRYVIGISEDITERRAAEARLTHIALHDSLTGLPNRVGFSRHLAGLLKQGAAAPAFALFSLDLDHFKAVNESRGHQAGDELLKEVARRLRRIAGEGSFVARLGVDEFAVIGRFAAPEEITAFAGRLLAGFDEPFAVGGCPESVTCSIGVAEAPLHGDAPGVLMANAGMALDAAKSGGRGVFRVYREALRHAGERRRALTAELRQALATEQFELHYQPIFNLASGRISGFEALIRWRHPERGMVPPADFIPLAEETGLIGPIGEWVLRSACREAAGWPEGVKVSANLSPVQFNQSTLLRSVTEALEAARLCAGRLELEITESVFLSNSRNNIEILFALRRLGVRIAMDDFGTGYSSLSYLRSFPFDKIKIDRSFVSGIEADARDLAIIQAVATLGQGFNIVTTAEGVETAQQLERLRAERFGEAQGFFIGRPMPAGEVPAFIRDTNDMGLAMAAARNSLPA